MPEVKEFSLSVEDAKRLFEEKIEGYRNQLGALDRELNQSQVQVDRRREEVAKLDQEIEQKQARLAQLSDKVGSGEAAFAEHRKNIEQTLDARERQANARVEAAEAAEASLAKEKQTLAQSHSTLAALRDDAIAFLGHAKEDAARSIEKAIEALSLLH